MKRILNGKVAEWAFVVFCGVAMIGAVIAGEALMAAIGGFATATWIDTAIRGEW